MAEEKEHFELGLGIGAASLPHYRGSDEHKNYLLPFPYFSYESKWLKVSREGGQLTFFKRPRFRINLSVGLTPPTDTKDNKARINMPDLDPTFQLGPRAEFLLYQSEDRRFQLLAGLPVRKAIVVSKDSLREIGWVFSPYLEWSYINKWTTNLTIGPIWTSDDFHRYFYEVEPQYAMANRPSYNAHSGYSGFRMTLYSNHRFDHTWLGFVARYDNLSGAVFEDSPLVKQKESFMVGIFIAKIFLNGTLPKDTN